MSIAAPWFLLMVTEAWRFGIHPSDGSPPHMPEPYRFILGSVAMGFAGIVSMANPKLGGLLAWGLLIGAIVRQAGPNPIATPTTTATAPDKAAKQAPVAR